MRHHHEQDDVTVREIPRCRYAAVGWLALALFLAGMTAWELAMRSLGLRTADIDDSPSHWAVERRKLENGRHDKVVIVGSSRILFDTDLDVWKEMTGRRPVQLALPGTSPRPYLASVAADTDFAGLVICDVAPEMFFSPFIGALPQFVGMQDSWRDETPSERFGHRVNLRLQRMFAFLENEYSLFRLVERIVVTDDRLGPDGPYYDVWKLSEAFEGRQYFLWHRVEQPGYLQDHAREAWGPFGNERPPLLAAHIDAAIADVVTSVARIRARGVHPCARATSASHTRRAAAPSLSVELLPAVTVPPLRKAGASAASASSVVSARGPSSRSTVVVFPFPAATSTGTISRLNAPRVWAATARWCERSANASWSARPIES
jgi:hypothetical protein